MTVAQAVRLPESESGVRAIRQGQAECLRVRDAGRDAEAAIGLDSNRRGESHPLRLPEPHVQRSAERLALRRTSPLQEVREWPSWRHGRVSLDELQAAGAGGGGVIATQKSGDGRPTQ